MYTLDCALDVFEITLQCHRLNTEPLSDVSDNDGVLICSYVEGPWQPVYRVVFWQKDLWEGYHGTDNDNLEIEVSNPSLGRCAVLCMLCCAVPDSLPVVCCA